MPASSHRRRGLRRTGAVLAAAALGATLAPVVTAEAATFKPADDGARITAYKWLNKQEFDFTVKSPALGSSQKVRVLIPKTWRWTSHATWPVLYVFHGGHADYTSWTGQTNIATTAKAWNAMVVMPEGANGSYTDWFNYGNGGSPKWETFHTQEVRQLIERNYHGGGIRAAMGNSSGGEGSITYAERHPGLFRYARPSAVRCRCDRPAFRRCSCTRTPTSAWTPTGSGATRGHRPGPPIPPTGPRTTPGRSPVG